MDKDPGFYRLKKRRKEAREQAEIEDIKNGESYHAMVVLLEMSSFYNDFTNRRNGKSCEIKRDCSNFYKL